MAPVDQNAIELARHELVAPFLAGRPDPGTKERRNSSLEAGIVGAIRSVVVALIAKLALSADQTLHGLIKKRIPSLDHNQPYCSIGQFNIQVTNVLKVRYQPPNTLPVS
jgi:hypothetical protein